MISRTEREYMLHPESTIDILHPEKRYRVRQRLKKILLELKDISALLEYFPPSDVGKILTEEMEIEAFRVANKIQEIRQKKEKIATLEAELAKAKEEA